VRLCLFDRSKSAAMKSSIHRLNSPQIAPLIIVCSTSADLSRKLRPSFPLSHKINQPEWPPVEKLQKKNQTIQLMSRLFDIIRCLRSVEAVHATPALHLFFPTGFEQIALSFGRNCGNMFISNYDLCTRADYSNDHPFIA
jgi:hypothetical protein